MGQLITEWPDEDTLRAWYCDDGLTLRQIAKRLDRGAATVLRHLWRLGIETRRPSKKRKVTDAEVRELRERYSAGGVTQQDLASEYGVSANFVHYLVAGKRRRDAGGPIKGEDY